jgi:hypothetical protein
MALRVIQLFANEDNGIYGDIYNTPEEVREEHPGATVLIGYGILNEETGFIVDESADFYATEAEALEHMEELI